MFKISDKFAVLVVKNLFENGKIEIDELVDSVIEAFDVPNSIRLQTKDILTILIRSANKQPIEPKMFLRTVKTLGLKANSPLAERAISLGFSARGVRDSDSMKALFEEFAKVLLTQLKVSSPKEVIRGFFDQPSEPTEMQRDIKSLMVSMEARDYPRVVQKLLNFNLIELLLKTASNLTWSLFSLQKGVEDDPRLRALVLLKICREMDKVVSFPELEAIYDHLSLKIITENPDTLAGLVSGVIAAHQTQANHLLEIDRPELCEQFLRDIEDLPEEPSVAHQVLGEVVKKVLIQHVPKAVDETNGDVSGFKRLYDEIGHINEILCSKTSVDLIGYPSEVEGLVARNSTYIAGMNPEENIFFKGIIMPCFFVLTHLNLYFLFQNTTQEVKFKGIFSMIMKFIDRVKLRKFTDDKFESDFPLFFNMVEKRLGFFFNLVEKRSFSCSELIEILDSDRLDSSQAKLDLLSLDSSGLVAELTTRLCELVDSGQNDELVAQSTKRYAQTLFKIVKHLEKDPRKASMIETILAILEGDRKKAGLVLSFFNIPSDDQQKIKILVSQHDIIQGVLLEVQRHSEEARRKREKWQEGRDNLEMILSRIRQKSVRSLSHLNAKLSKLGLKIPPEELQALLDHLGPREELFDNLTLGQVIDALERSISSEIGYNVYFEGLDIFALQILIFLLLIFVSDFVLSTNAHWLLLKSISLLAVLFLLGLVTLCLRFLLRAYFLYSTRKLIEKRLRSYTEPDQPSTESDSETVDSSLYSYYP